MRTARNMEMRLNRPLTLYNIKRDYEEHGFDSTGPSKLMSKVREPDEKGRKLF